MSKATTTSTPPHQQHQPMHGQPMQGQMQGQQIPHDKIAKRAYEKWCKRGKPHGTEMQDWYEAEAELRAEMGKPGAQPQQRRM
jgi:hypothetical protein